MSVLLTHGMAGFTTQSTRAIRNGPRALAVADLDGDAKPDIATDNADEGTPAVLLWAFVHPTTTRTVTSSAAPRTTGTALTLTAQVTPNTGPTRQG